MATEMVSNPAEPSTRQQRTARSASWRRYDIPVTVSVVLGKATMQVSQPPNSAARWWNDRVARRSTCVNNRPAARRGRWWMTAGSG
jgi:hypothetical protein